MKSRTTQFVDYYARLGVPADASLAEIKSAYRNLVKPYHPDVYPYDDPTARRKAELAMHQINEAYAILSDSAERQRYDKQYQEYMVAHIDSLTSEGRMDSLTEAQPEGYQKYIDQMLNELEESYTTVRRKTSMWSYLAIAFASTGIVVLLTFCALVLGSAITTATSSSQFIKSTPTAVAWLAAGISLISIGTLVYRQVRETHLQIDDYYLERIQEAKRLSQSITFSSRIETDEKTKDQLNELIIQRLLSFLTQEQEIPKQPSRDSPKR